MLFGCLVGRAHLKRILRLGKLRLRGPSGSPRAVDVGDDGSRLRRPGLRGISGFAKERFGPFVIGIGVTSAKVRFLALAVRS
jgi:hypothetical protein